MGQVICSNPMLKNQGVALAHPPGVKGTPEGDLVHGSANSRGLSL